MLHLAELPDVGPYGLLGFGFMKHKRAEKNRGQQQKHGTGQMIPS